MNKQQIIFSLFSLCHLTQKMVWEEICRHHGCLQSSWCNSAPRWCRWIRESCNDDGGCDDGAMVCFLQVEFVISLPLSRGHYLTRFLRFVLLYLARSAVTCSAYGRPLSWRRCQTMVARNQGAARRGNAACPESDRNFSSLGRQNHLWRKVS